MVWLVLILILSFLGEIIDAYFSHLYLKKMLAYLLILIISLDSLVILNLRPALWSALIVYVSIFRVFNLYRLIDGRKQPDYLRSSFIRSSLMLSGFQLVILGLTYIGGVLKISFGSKWTILILAELAMVLIIASSLRRSLIKSRPKVAEEYMGGSKLPSLSVAIPARNETQDLEDCLRSLIASDYPKLEILVLDDSSQEKRTPEI